MKKISLVYHNIVSRRIANVASISFGTLAGQLISIISLPIYTRIFGAEVMGDWALISSISVIVNTFSDLGLSNAIMIEEDEDKNKKLFSMITLLVFVISFIVGILCLLYNLFFPTKLKMNGMFYCMFIFVQIFTSQQVQISYTWLNRDKQYKILMLNPVINNLSSALISIILGMFGFITYGYYVGIIMGQIATLIHMKRKLPRLILKVNISDYREIFFKYKEFIIYQMPTNIVTQLKNQAPVFLIKLFFGSEILGYYSVSMRVLKIPVTLLANAIGKVYYQTIAEMKRKGENIGNFTYRNVKRALSLAIFPMIILLSCSDMVCQIFMGKEFIMAGNITRIVCFNSLFTFLMMATQGIAVVLHKQKISLISSVIQVIGYFIGLYIGRYLFNNIYIGCFLMTIVFCLAQIVYFAYMFKILNISLKKYFMIVLGTILIIFVMAMLIRTIGNAFGIFNGI